MAFIEVSKDNSKPSEVQLSTLAKGQTFEVNGHVWMTTKLSLNELAKMVRSPAGELGELIQAFKLDDDMSKEIVCLHLQSGDISHFTPELEVIPTKSCKLNWSV